MKNLLFISILTILFSCSDSKSVQHDPEAAYQQKRNEILKQRETERYKSYIRIKANLDTMEMQSRNDSELNEQVMATRKEVELQIINISASLDTLK